jgi:hypothetical protein
MTDERIKAVFEEYGQFVTGKEYALIRAIAEAVAPPRTWVGLTDEELPLLAGDNGKRMELQQVRRFYKYIEAKLKQKNGYAEEKNT